MGSLFVRPVFRSDFFMIQIKSIEPTDAGLIADISRETFYDTFAIHNTKADMDKFLAEQFSREQLMKEVLEPGNTFFLASVDGIPAGYLFLKDRSHHLLGTAAAMEISRLYVRKPFIGKGVGKLLMQHAIDHARQIQKDTVWLGVWEHNQPAITFYTSFGYQQFGEHDFILGDDVQRDWLMQRPVNL